MARDPYIPKTRVVAATTLLLITAACNLWSEQRFVDVVNETEETLVVISVSGSGIELELEVLEPGNKYSQQVSDCIPTPTGAQLVVQTTDGALYARQPEQLCADDVWTITEPDP